MSETKLVAHEEQCPALCQWPLESEGEPQVAFLQCHFLHHDHLCTGERPACKGAKRLAELELVAGSRIVRDYTKSVRRAERAESERAESNRILIKATDDYKGLMSLCQRTTEERDAARAEVERLKGTLKKWENVETAAACLRLDDFRWPWKVVSHPTAAQEWSILDSLGVAIVPRLSPRSLADLIVGALSVLAALASKGEGWKDQWHEAQDKITSLERSEKRLREALKALCDEASEPVGWEPSSTFDEARAALASKETK